MKSRVSIQVAAQNGHSFLRQVYAEPPFKVADITETSNPQQLELMLMSASPGTLDHDRYDINIVLEENSALQFTTQSYQRLFNMEKGAGQNMVIRMARGASFIYLPHPVVPHESSVFRASNKIYLSDGCTVTWSEILTCGRKLNGERFLFSFYQTATEIYLNGKLVVKENLRMAPASTAVDTIGQLEGFTHQASLLCLSPLYDVDEIKEQVIIFLAGQQDVLFGVTAAPVNGLIIRLLGKRAEQLFACIKNLAALMRTAIVKPVEINE